MLHYFYEAIVFLFIFPLAMICWGTWRPKAHLIFSFFFKKLTMSNLFENLAFFVCVNTISVFFIYSLFWTSLPFHLFFLCNKGLFLFSAVFFFFESWDLRLKNENSIVVLPVGLLSASAALKTWSLSWVVRVLHI